MSTILVTVGTSLLTNRDEAGTVERPWAPWRRPAALPSVTRDDTANFSNVPMRV